MFIFGILYKMLVDLPYKTKVHIIIIKILYGKGRSCTNNNLTWNECS